MLKVYLRNLALGQKIEGAGAAPKVDGSQTLQDIRPYLISSIQYPCDDVDTEQCFGSGSRGFKKVKNVK